MPDDAREPDDLPGPKGETPDRPAAIRWVAIMLAVIGVLTIKIPIISVILAILALVIAIGAIRGGEPRKTSIIAVVLAGIVLLAGIGGMLPSRDAESTDQAPTTIPAQTDTVEPEDAAPVETESGPSLAQRVDAQVLSGLDHESYLDACLGGISWACGVTELADGGHGIVEVHVQDSFDDKEDAEKVARSFLNFSCIGNDDLEWIVIYDAGGVVRAQTKPSDSYLCVKE